MIDEKKLLEKLEELKFANEEKGYDTAKDVVQEVIDLVNEQPQADKWIPCSEESTPKEAGTYLISGHWLSGKEHVGEAEYIGEWKVVNNFIIEAWQSLPTPYKKEGAENGNG